MKINNYESFKMKWMADHGFTLRDLMLAIENYRKDLPPETPLDEVFVEWENDSGFGSQMWPCYDEACGSGELDEESAYSEKAKSTIRSLVGEIAEGAEDDYLEEVMHQYFTEEEAKEIGLMDYWPEGD